MVEVIVSGKNTSSGAGSFSVHSPNKTSTSYCRRIELTSGSTISGYEGSYDSTKTYIGLMFSSAAVGSSTINFFSKMTFFLYPNDPQLISMIGINHCSGVYSSSWTTSEFRVLNKNSAYLPITFERDGVTSTFSDVRFIVKAYKKSS